MRTAADTRNWRPKHVTAAPVGLGPAAEPMVGRSLVGAALPRYNAAYAPSSLVCFVGQCALQAVDAALGNPVIKSWLQICRNDNIRRWKTQKLSLSKQTKSWWHWKTSFKQRWDYTIVSKCVMFENIIREIFFILWIFKNLLSDSQFVCVCCKI